MRESGCRQILTPLFITSLSTSLGFIPLGSIFLTAVCFQELVMKPLKPERKRKRKVRIIEEE
jgi:hypothetical protein